MRISSLFCVVLALTLAESTASAECIKDATVEQLIDAGVKGESAFADGDLKQLRFWAGQAREELIPCMKVPLAPKQVAIFHRLMAMDALTRYNFERVKKEFHAARRLEPGYAIPPEVAEGDHPLLTFYEEAALLPDGEPEPIFAPKGGYVVVGGVRNAPRMQFTPVVIQVYGPPLQVDTVAVWIETRYVQSGEKLPIWGENVFGLTAEQLGVDATSIWKKPTPWYISAGVSAALSITFYALAMNEKSKFEDGSTPDGDLSNLRDRANAFGYTAATTGGLALVLTGIGVGFQIGFGGDEKSTIAPATLAPSKFHQPFESGVFP
jgi:hypothetical protein